MANIIDEFYKFMIKNGKSQKTANNYISTLKNIHDKFPSMNGIEFFSLSNYDISIPLIWEEKDFELYNSKWHHALSASIGAFNKFLDYKKLNDCSYLSIKISNPAFIDVVNRIKACEKGIVIRQLNQLKDNLKTGQLVFMVPFGDKVSWEKGLYGIGKIAVLPYDFEGKNFKIKIDMFCTFKCISRDEFIPYLGTYNAADIGPSTKGSQNQAIKQISLDQTASIIRAIIELRPEAKTSIFENVDKKIIDLALGEQKILYPNYSKYIDLTRLKGDNVIYYGIPGCGKSHHIEHTVLKNADKDNDVFRTTFYLDYSNSDFVGQLMPDIKDDGTPIYRRIPGPFTKALARAYEKKDRMIYLVIEEINRGNATAIFGDVFQLLDRIKDGPDKGKSEYPVYNEFINSYLEEKELNKPNNQIYIPSNLTILATMNTSDQNVFPLDTAFKRRWDRERVTANWDECTFKDDYIPFTDYTWYDFVNLVNDKMIKSSEDGMILEDKQIGAFFINKDILASKDDKDIVNEENKTKLRKFVNNVIDYIYTDVSKFDRKNWFKEQVSFDDIYDAICKYEYKKDDNDQVILDTNNKPIEEYHGDKELYLLLDTIKNKVADIYE